MKAVLCERFGEPAQSLAVRDVPQREPGYNQVRIRMLASPINPSDLLAIRGTYGTPPPLAAAPGLEGAGVIDAVGPGFFKVVRGLRRGRRVAVLNAGGGNWQESVVVPARHVVPVPADIPDEQAASFFVNPATVLAMSEHVLCVQPGQWLLQTAAASALGKMVIRLGKQQGFRTINVVRRGDQIDELRRLGPHPGGATERERVEEQARELTKGRGVPFALDAVGGTMGLDAVRALGAGGRLLVYGVLSGEPIAIDPRLLIGGQKRIEGFWLSEWA